MGPTQFQWNLILLDLQMAHAKAELKNNGDKISPCLDHFEQETSQTNIYPFGLSYRFHLNTF
jgi:hypothetical protein